MCFPYLISGLTHGGRVKKGTIHIIKAKHMVWLSSLVEISRWFWKWVAAARLRFAVPAE